GLGTVDGVCLASRPWLSDKHWGLYESDNGSFSSPRESPSGGLSGSSETETAQLKPAVLWQSHNLWRPRRFVRQPPPEARAWRAEPTESSTSTAGVYRAEHIALYS